MLQITFSVAMHSGIASQHEVVQFCLRIGLKEGQFFMFLNKVFYAHQDNTVK